MLQGVIVNGVHVGRVNDDVDQRPVACTLVVDRDVEDVASINNQGSCRAFSVELEPQRINNAVRVFPAGGNAC